MFHLFYWHRVLWTQWGIPKWQCWENLYSVTASMQWNEKIMEKNKKQCFFILFYLFFYPVKHQILLTHILKYFSSLFDLCLHCHYLLLLFAQITHTVSWLDPFLQPPSRVIIWEKFSSMNLFTWRHLILNQPLTRPSLSPPILVLSFLVARLTFRVSYFLFLGH